MFRSVIFGSILSVTFGQIYLHSCKFNANPSFVSNVSVALFNDSDGVSRVNLSITLKTNLKDIIVYTAFNAKSRTTNEYNIPFAKGHVNTCSVQKGIIGSFIVQSISENLANHSNFRFQCPLQSGVYYARNFPVMDVKSLPLFLLRRGVGRSVEWEASGYIRVKASKTLAQAGSFKAYGSTVF